MRFLSPLTITIDRSNDWEAAKLERSLSFETSWGFVIEVPAGYTTDLVSVPCWARPFIPRFEGETASAAVVHDYLYSTHCVPRWVADGILYEALIASGVSSAKSFVMWASVRLGGLRGWSEEFFEAQKSNLLFAAGKN